MPGQHDDKNQNAPIAQPGSLSGQIRDLGDKTPGMAGALPISNQNRAGTSPEPSQQRSGSPIGAPEGAIGGTALISTRLVVTG
jgi:hypothetical protein